jgi:hypothetical protein
MNRKIIIIISILIVIAIILAFLFINKTTSLATVYVDPQTTEKVVGQNFTVNISVSDIANLYGWEFKLGWNLTILDLVNVTEGAFLKSGRPTFFTYRLNVTGSYVLIDCTLLGNVTGASGNGVLASIEFHVKESGTCDLSLYDTKLEDPSEEMLTHTTNGGRLTANP